MRRIGIAALYVLAFLVILGRIGSALYGNRGPLAEIIKLYPPLSGEMIGADLESLSEDLIVFFAIRHAVRTSRERGSEKAKAENEEATR